MGIADEETNPRTKKKKLEPDNISRSTSAARGEIACTGNQQERISREDCSRSAVFDVGTRVTGKMLDHLITEYQDQVAAKENEIATLKARIEGFKMLKEELHKEEPE
jgi:hypothetical protein